MTFSLHRLAFAAATCLAAAVQAQTVTPPPLPPGSALVRLDPGMNEAERKRHVRAHHHKFHHGKDFTRDDSVHGPESEVAARAAPGPQQGAGAGSAGAVQDGRGTGPGREKTDKGASSWFYGQPDKK